MLEARRVPLGWVLALLTVFPIGAQAQLRTVVSNEIASSGREASLSLDFEDQAGLDIALRDGQVLVDGEAVGTFTRGDALDLAWHSLLGDVIALEDGPLAQALFDWSPPADLSGEEARIASLLDSSLEEALSLPQEAFDAQASDADNPVDLSKEGALFKALLRRSGALEGLGNAVAGLDLESFTLRIGEDMHVAAGEELEGTLVLVDGDLEVEGTIRGDVILVGGTVDLAEGGRITGDLRLSDGHLEAQGGELEGDLLDLETNAPSTVEVKELEELRSDLERQIRREVLSEMDRGDRSSRERVLYGPFHALGRALAGLMEDLVTFLIVSILGVLTVHFARERFDIVAATARRAPARTAMVGLAGGFLLIPIWILGMVALAVSVIGIPVLLAWIPFFPIVAGMAGLLGYLAVAKNVGEWVADQEYRGLEWIRGSNAFYTVVAGIGALMVPCVAANLVGILGLGFLQGLLTFVGSMITFAVLAVGFGAVLLTRGGKIRPMESYYEFDDDFYAEAEADTGPADPTEPSGPSADAEDVGEPDEEAGNENS